MVPPALVGTYGVVNIELCISQAKKKEMEAAAAAATAAGMAGVVGAPQTVGAIKSTGVGGVTGTGSNTLVAGVEGSARRDDAVVTNEPVYCICRQVGWGDMVREDCAFL